MSKEDVKNKWMMWSLRNLRLEGRKGKGKEHVRNKREGKPEVVTVVF